MEKNKAVFLDRDGTIIRDKGYSFDPDAIEFIPDVVPNLKRLQAADYLLIIVTNQSGVARGLFSEQELEIFNDRLRGMLSSCGVHVSRIYYCPHHPQGIIPRYSRHCSCRKPGVELFRKATLEFDLDLSQCYAIGDNLRDCAICLESECTGCLLSSEDRETPKNIFRFEDFRSCTDFILEGY